MIQIIFTLMIGISPIPTLSQEESPWNRNTIWEYRNAQGKNGRILLGISEKIRIKGEEVSARRMQMLGRNLFLVEKKGELWLVAKEFVGYAGSPRNVLLAIFRWNGEKKWAFNTGSGCLLWTVSCTREGTEKIRVGTKDILCTRFQIGKETWWLSPEKGIVKCTRPDGTWILQRTAKHRHKCATGLVCWPCGAQRRR